MVTDRKFILKTFSIVTIAIVNMLFGYKYFSRYTDFTLPLIIALLISYFLIFYLDRISIIKRNAGLLVSLSVILFTGLSIVVFYNIPVESLNVDRWSVIQEFWNKALKGDYPYYAKSNMGNPPGPMPVYFLLVFPFNLIHETGYFSILGSFLFIGWLYYHKVPKILILKSALFIFFSVFYLWEVVTRSNIFTNATIILLLFSGFNNEHRKPGKSYLYAFFSGIFLSTRNILILPYFISIVNHLRRKTYNFRELLAISLLMAFSFVLTFLPLIFIFPHDFFKMNPFIVQSGFLVPPLYIFLFFGISVGLAFLVREKEEIYFFSGLSLFLTSLIYFLYYILKSGFHQAYVESEADISYFIFGIPFLLYYIIQTECKIGNIRN